MLCGMGGEPPFVGMIATTEAETEAFVHQGLGRRAESFKFELPVHCTEAVY